jgi:hypothetical protein
LLKRTPHCSTCDAVLRGARLVIDGRWCCPDCAYEHDYGAGACVQPQPVRRRRAQRERLFDPDETVR